MTTPQNNATGIAIATSPSPDDDAERQRLLRELERALIRQEREAALISPEPVVESAEPGHRVATAGDPERRLKGGMSKGSLATRTAAKSMRIGRELLRQRRPAQSAHRSAASSGSAHLLSRVDIETDPVYRRGAAIVFGHAARD